VSEPLEEHHLSSLAKTAKDRRYPLRPTPSD
jgi:hypothetical protein